MCGKAAKVRISEQQQSVLKNRRRRMFGSEPRDSGSRYFAGIRQFVKHRHQHAGQAWA